MTSPVVLVGDDGSTGAAAARTWADAYAAVVDGEVVTTRAVAETTLPATEHLLACANDVGARLIVVGRRGAGGFAALELGSTALQVAEHSPLPVAIVPQALAGRHARFDRLILGLDGSEASGAAADFVAELASAQGAQVWAVHATDMGLSLAAAGIDDAMYASAFGRLHARLANDWASPLRSAGVDHEVVIEEGGPAGVLLDVAHRHAADLVALGRSTTRFWLGSVARRVAAVAPSPTIVVPAMDDAGATR